MDASNTVDGWMRSSIRSDNATLENTRLGGSSPRALLSVPVHRRRSRRKITRFIAIFLFSLLTLPLGLAKAANLLVLNAIDPPTITLGVPATATIGSTITFPVTFDNNDPDFETGYGPFIELQIPRTGADGNDGLGTTTISATYLGTPIPAADFFVRTFAGVGTATHPLVRDNIAGRFLAVSGTTGNALVVIRLPFGSFTYDQPPATVMVTVNMSNLADLNYPLTVLARGGYQYGFTPLDDWCCGDLASTTLSTNVTGSVLPTLFTLTKTYAGPADISAETATGPNFPRSYTVTVDIAQGQTITDLRVTDLLPNNEQYLSLDSAAPGGYIVENHPSSGTGAAGTATVNDGGTPGDPSDDSIDFTPAIGYTGLVSFNYQICDAGGDCDTANVSFHVTAVTDTPNAVDDMPADVAVNSGLANIAVLANDTFGNDGPSGSAITIVTGPGAAGIAAVNDGGTPGDPSNDSIDFTPAIGYSGAVSFRYQICDSGGDCDTATVSFNVAAATATPNAVDDMPIDVAVNSGLTNIAVLANDTFGSDGPSGSAITIPNDLVVRWPSVTGGAGANDASATLSFFVPRDDAAGGRVINPATGAAVSSCNNAQASGSWTPIDTRDSIQSTSINPAGCEHTLADRSLAIQKSIPNLDYTPGDVVEYTLEFQVSDFFAFDQLTITDVLSDGQHFDIAPASVPTLQVNGNGYALAAAAFDPTNYTVNESNIGVPPPSPLNPEGDATNGTTILTFRVSNEIITRGQSGLLIGGCVNPAGGSANPDCAAYNNAGTTATIRFRAIIQEDFTDVYPSGDWSVDQGDTFLNNATISGRLLDTNTFMPGPVVTDNATEGFAIATGALTKSIYAINGNTTIPSPVSITPGDTVTYRIRYAMPTSDEENLEFLDYLPLPIFFVADPDANDYNTIAPAGAHNDGPAWSFVPTVSATVPATGVAKFGPDDTFYTYSGIAPTLTANAANNRLRFYYGDYDNPASQSRTVDLLFTVTVATEPFADSMYLTNQAHAIEGSTNAGEIASDGIIQVILTEPVVRSTKGIIWTSNTDDIYNPVNTGPAGVAFQDPSFAPRWTGLINSSGLAARPINSNVRDVDAGDIVTFAIKLENSGTSVKGAFDIQLQDVLQPQYQIPLGGLNLQVYYGNQNTSFFGPISYRGLTSSCTAVGNNNVCGEEIFQAGIELIDPVGAGVCQAHDPNLGNNVILITYDLQIRDSVSPGNIVNRETLLRYAGDEGGPNHVPTPSPYWDEATITVSGAPVKYIVSTSENHTVPVGGVEQVAIGEIIRYRAVTRIPESTITNFQLLDLLPAGLIFLDDGTATIGFVSNGGITSTAPSPPYSFPAIPVGCNLVGTTADATHPAVLPCTLADFNIGSNNSSTADPDVYASGTDIYFKLGDLANPDRDDDGEFVVIEFNALVHNLTTDQNDSGDNRDNSVQTYSEVSPVPFGSASPALRARIVEPVLQIAKAVDDSHPAPGQTVTFTVLVDHAAGSNADAFDIVLQDSPPSGLILDPDSITITPTGGVSGVADHSTASQVDISIDTFPLAGSLTVTYQAQVTAPFGTTINNTAAVDWTSLPGPDANERTGADGVGGTKDDYAANSSAAIHLNRNLAKTLTGDNHPAPVTTLPDVTIGEILTYQLVLTIPPASTDTFTVTDLLDSGLAFVDCEDITADADLTSSTVALHAAGNCNPGSGGASNPLVTNNGGTVTFNFGTVINASPTFAIRRLKRAILEIVM